MAASYHLHILQAVAERFNLSFDPYAVNRTRFASPDNPSDPNELLFALNELGGHVSLAFLERRTTVEDLKGLMLEEVFPLVVFLTGFPLVMGLVLRMQQLSI